jgi:alpha-D-glucose phosphate-specific phosphoglucomutase
MANIRFGTDGWRGLIARDFTFDNVALCAQGVANYLRQEGTAGKGLVVGYDTRFASEEFAARVAEVMAGNGIATFLSGRAAPTPVVSYNILRHKAAGASIITASHNPASWNGFKYKPDYAGSAPPEVTSRLEREIEKAEIWGAASMPLQQARDEGLVQGIDPMPPYLEQMARLVDLDAISGAGLNVVVDAMHGAGAGYLPSLLSPRHVAGGDGKAVSTSVLEINGERNPAFPGMERPEPIAHNLSSLSHLVVERGADVGIAFDGDADRVGIIDEKGTFITPLQTFALLALYLLEIKGERGALVKSLTTTMMVYRLGEIYGVPVFETPVGFKYVCPVMLRENALIGGEESGGYGFRGHIPERDGILSGLTLLEYMARTGKRPSELMDHLFSVVGPHHYQRRDISFSPESRQSLLSRLEGGELVEVARTPVTSTDAIDGRRFFFPSNAWLLVRFSGTEPLLRIYAEAESPERVEELLDGAEAFLDI